MVKRHNRLLVAFHVVTDSVLGMVAFLRPTSCASTRG